MKWWLLRWLVLFLVVHNTPCIKSEANPGVAQGVNKNPVQGNNAASVTANGEKCNFEKLRLYKVKKPKNCFHRNKPGVPYTRSCMEEVDTILKSGRGSHPIKAMELLEELLTETELNETTSLSVGSMVAILYKPKGPFKGLNICATDDNETLSEGVTNSRVSVRLPRELDAGSNNTVVFCMLTWLKGSTTLWGRSYELYERRLVGLSVAGKNITGLQEHVNITVNLAGNGTTTSFNKSFTETLQPKCVFLNFSTQAYSTDGCITLWEFGQSHVTCSCDHLTYFGVLMVSANISPKDQEIMSYITVIGCSLSLLTLIITVLLFITNRKARADLSMKVHIHLVIALILLNLHFLPSQAVALSSTGFCFYMALSLHYSLLATFIWMSLEGFHLYLLLVRVFNIYVRKYVLKLSVVGWGIPAVIVALVVIIDRSSYGRVPLDSANSNSTAICYIVNNTVKMVTTVGVFCLVFIFNMFMLGMTVRSIVILRRSKEVSSSSCVCFHISDGNMTITDNTLNTTIHDEAPDINCSLLLCNHSAILPMMNSLTSHNYEADMMQLFYIRNSCQDLFRSHHEVKKAFINVERTMVHKIMGASQLEPGGSINYHLKDLSLSVLNFSEAQLNDYEIKKEAPQLLPQNTSFIPDIWLPADALHSLPKEKRVIGLVSYMQQSQFKFKQEEISSMVLRIEVLGENRLQGLRKPIKMTFKTALHTAMDNESWFQCHYFHESGRNHKMDYSISIHVSLSGALLLLNTTFLLTEWGATVEPAWVCVFVAALMHYSLLCCFTWMAIEALHLYLLLIKVFNTYFKRYLVKLSLADG
ncbi:uncharacterized protein LOC116692218 [Etheostoma spectabile]|uniref:uncharacterized protein LOC116692218 n=1 Tax=Etheostoma spectabile TaxID=54343 RepID=UPI0013AECC82|nr:uncharacterized protein LOC116692218 [Etheostoma spectabile]